MTTDDPLRSQIARKFTEAIKALRISKAQAARDLEVSRQMLYGYLKGKSLPKREVLQRACSAWNLELNYRTLIVNRNSFSQVRTNVEAVRPVQLKLDLQEAIENLRDEDLAVRILRKTNGRVELQVNVKFGSAS